MIEFAQDPEEENEDEDGPIHPGGTPIKPGEEEDEDEDDDNEEDEEGDEEERNGN